MRPSRPLSAAAEKDLRVFATGSREAGHTVALVPLEGRLPSERLEPRETAAYIGDVQDRADGAYSQIAADSTVSEASP